MTQAIWIVLIIASAAVVGAGIDAVVKIVRACAPRHFRASFDVDSGVITAEFNTEAQLVAFISRVTIKPSGILKVEP